MALAGLTQSAVAQTGAGGLTTHVLDLTKGKPGGGVKVALYVIEGGQKRLLKTAVTNRDGRTDGPMLAGQAFHAGRYELVFSVGDYFRSQGMETSDPGFLDEVPIAFGISDPSQHYHVPLVVSPWAYSTYRGS
ncbi:hydroxyisourate hydrolase [Herbaspirillum sp. LeCh32-8]|uniref:hydroxyisourate hydrolase n=1 Tax=Herbaspirillum sp. LeCh32-8 TaxID=2821356 RepID=UPI001AE11B84|nr:hydroxyisourate hydrolase [Herbaspirillum sp. LeCh32-8]MBP0596483.1 hydroxyisourate hydrolase [Herbaspirillum sp. LeCh32-8]